MSLCWILNGARANYQQDGSTDVPWASVVLRHYAQLSSILGRVGEGEKLDHRELCVVYL